VKKAKTKKVKYREGDWFGVPLESGGWGIGIVARRDKRGGIVGFFFGPPRKELPKSTEELDRLHHTQAVWRADIGSLGIERGTWPILGHHANWSHERFPNPWFGWIDTSGRVAHKTQWCPDEHPDEPLEEYCPVEEAMQLPGNDAFPAGAAEWTLDQILAGRHRELADPRPGTLPWTDKFPPPLDPKNPYGHVLPKKISVEEELAMSPDEQVLAAMAESSDMDKPHVVDHRLYFKTRPDAMAAKKELTKLKFQCEPLQKIGSGERPWKVLARHLIVPTFEAIEAENERLTALAEKYGGEYDGWEAETVPVERH
jgi:hypothetical protein